jgi:hypothetical protein
MGKVCWDFPLLGTGNQSGNNIAAITMFKGTGIMDGLAREVCQNSLDARNKDLPADIPVKVKFELVEIEKSKYPMFEGYKKALESSIDYWTTSPLSTPKIMEFLSNVKKALDNETIPMLVMSDYNTVGLNGVNATDDEAAEGIWDALAGQEAWLKIEIPNKTDKTYIPIVPIKTGAYNLAVNDRITIRLKYTISGDMKFGETLADAQ